MNAWIARARAHRGLRSAGLLTYAIFAATLVSLASPGPAAAQTAAVALTILEPAANASYPAGTAEIAVAGVVSDAGGAPIKGAAVKVFSTPADGFATASSDTYGKFAASGLALAAGGNTITVTAATETDGATASLAVTVAEAPPETLETPLDYLLRALAALEALIDGDPDGGDLELLEVSRDELTAAIDGIGEPCRAGAVKRLGTAAGAAAEVAGTDAIVDDVTAGGQLLVAESMEVLARRVGDRHPRTDDALARFDDAGVAPDAVARLGLLHGAEEVACVIFDDGPRLLLLAREPARVTTLSYYSLRQLSETAMPAALGQTGASVAGLSQRQAVALDHRRGIAVTFDPTRPEPEGATDFGAARLLAAGDSGRYAVADLRAGVVRIFDPADGEIAQLPWSAPPLALALGPDGGTVASATALGTVVMQRPGGEEIPLDTGGDAFVWSLAFGAGAGEVFAVTSGAVVKRVSADGGLLATSGWLPGLRDCVYLAEIERVACAAVKTVHTAVELLDGDDLETIASVDLSDLIEFPTGLTAVGGRDLVIPDARTTVIVDASTAEVIETIEHSTTVVPGVAPGR